MKNNIEEMRPDISEICGEELEYSYCVGPLNLNKATKRACTALGVELFLDEKMFGALDLLASRVGDCISSEELGKAVCAGSEDPDRKEMAQESVDNLIKLISATGHGFMWIEYLPEEGYIFKTHWGHNWKTQSAPVMQEPDNEPTEDELTATMLKFKKRRSRHRPPLAAVIAGAAAVAAAIILALMFLLNAPVLQPGEVEPAYAEFDDPQIPLASFDLEED